MTSAQTTYETALKTAQAQAARAIRSRVEKFSDRRLNDGDNVWFARELEMRCAVAETANAIAAAFAAGDPTFDLAAFAAACGLYVSEGRDNYSDCFPGELTWEIPRAEVAAPVSDRHLADALPEHAGWRAAYDYPGFINYTHPDSAVMVCACSDFNGDGKLDIQIQTADGQSFDDGENDPWPPQVRTAEALFARLRPYLDKYHPSAAKGG